MLSASLIFYTSSYQDEDEITRIYTFKIQIKSYVTQTAFLLPQLTGPLYLPDPLYNKPCFGFPNLYTIHKLLRALNIITSRQDTNVKIMLRTNKMCYGHGRLGKCFLKAVWAWKCLMIEFSCCKSEGTARQNMSC